MFFDIILLNPQHRGNFGIAWIVATRGIKYVQVKQIRALDLCKLCQDLMQFVISESTSPKKRFSLRLSGILLNGTVKIFLQQANLLQQDINHFIQNVHIPKGLGITIPEEYVHYESPLTPIVKVKSKRTKKQPKLTESQNGNIISNGLEDILQQAATSDLITIRDEARGVLVPPEEEGFGVLNEKELEEFLTILPTKPRGSTSSSSLSQPLEATKLVVVAQIHAPRGEVESQVAVSEMADVPRGEVELPKDVDTTVPPPQEPSVAAQAMEIVVAPSAPGPVTEIMEAEPSAVVATIEMDQPAAAARSEQVDENIVVPLGTRRPALQKRISSPSTQNEDRLTQLDRIIKNFFYYNTQRAVVRINRCNPKQNELVEEICVLPDKLRSTGHECLFELYLPKEDDQDQSVRRAGSAQQSTNKSSSLRLSLGLHSLSHGRLTTLGRSATPTSQVGVQELPAAGETPTVVGQIDVRSIVPEQRTEVPVDAIEVAVPPPADMTAVERTLEPLQVTEEVVIPPAAYRRATKPVVTSIISRQKKIIDLVSTWDFKQSMLTLEDICDIPVNKLNIARAFSDVLTLCASKYLRLISFEDSLQLKCIEKGPKLL